MFILTGQHDRVLEQLTNTFYAVQYKRLIMLTQEEIDDYADDVLALVCYASKLKTTIVKVPDVNR